MAEPSEKRYVTGRMLTGNECIIHREKTGVLVCVNKTQLAAFCLEGRELRQTIAFALRRPGRRDQWLLCFEQDIGLLADFDA